MTDLFTCNLCRCRKPADLIRRVDFNTLSPEKDNDGNEFRFMSSMGNPVIGQWAPNVCTDCLNALDQFANPDKHFKPARTNDGSPAFPCNKDGRTEYGLTKEEYVATKLWAAALPAWISANLEGKDRIENTVGILTSAVLDPENGDAQPNPAKDLPDPVDLKRRVAVEQILFDVANGKRQPLSQEDCKILALRLGTPEEMWSDATKKHEFR